MALDMSTRSNEKSKLRHEGNGTAPAIDKGITLYHKQMSPKLKLNICIQATGSRGDIQPFVALGQGLKKAGHRVRLTTHTIFEDFVTGAGLEFYPVNLDAKLLVVQIAQNPRFLTNLKSIGKINGIERMIGDMIDSCWDSCIADDPITKRPFVADAIVANPLSMGHVHCAQIMGGIPVHLVFPGSYSRTKAFPHSLVKRVSFNPGMGSYVSYIVMQWIAWIGFVKVVNQFRAKHGMDPVPITEGPGLHDKLMLPFTFCWSPSFVPRPSDWGSHIEVSGFLEREPPSYTPDPSLLEFLKAGPPPVYIGFGSMIIKDSQKLADVIFQTVKHTGIRAVISRGWSQIPGTTNETVYFIEDCPHEWLFQQVSAVVHHGGAGTTACGLRHGRPTAIVSFLGDQRFWGHFVAKAGAGPRWVEFEELNSENLADSINFCLKDTTKAAAEEIGMNMQKENGVEKAVEHIHRTFPLGRMRCDILPDQPAVWSYSKSSSTLHLSKAAAQILIDNKRIVAEDLSLYNVNPIVIRKSPWSRMASGIKSATKNLLTCSFRSQGPGEKENNNPVSKSQKLVIDAKLREGEYLVGTEEITEVDRALVLETFERLTCG